MLKKSISGNVGKTYDLRKSIDSTEQKTLELIEIPVKDSNQTVNISLNSTNFDERPSIFQEESKGQPTTNKKVHRFLQVPETEPKAV